MPSAKKIPVSLSPPIEPDLKEFIDECLVPMLVRDALRELATEIQFTPARPAVIKSARSQEAK